MAEIDDRSVPYEILIRFDEAGLVSGAHLVSRRIVTIDGERLKDEVGGAVPVALALGGSGGAVLDDVLGDALTAALAAVDRLTAEVAAKEAEIAAASVAEVPTPATG
jgi:hypothetical protein